MLFLELTVVVLLIVLNGLLSMSELAIVSAKRTRLQRMADQNVKGSRRALALAADPGKFLSTVQIGITLVGVLSGAFSGATVGVRMAGALAAFGLSQQLADALGVGLVVAIITYASLIVGELVPKQIALSNPEAVAVRVAPAMTVLAKIALPLSWLLEKSSDVLLSVMGSREASEGRVTEDDIRTVVAEAANAGVLEPGEQEMIAGVMRLGDRPVRAVMTPRVDVEMLDLSKSPAALRQDIAKSVHSRLPVHDGNPDEMLGVVHAKDLLKALIEDADFDVRKLARHAPMIPDSVDARDVLSIFKASPVHVALVLDEYGHFEGVVTAADILEAIAGEFLTDESATERAAVRRDDGSYLVSGWMPADAFSELTGIPLPEGRGYHTVAGFVLSKFGMLPSVGDVFDSDGWRFEILDLDGRRIDKLLVSKLPPTRRQRVEHR